MREILWGGGGGGGGGGAAVAALGVTGIHLIYCIKADKVVGTPEKGGREIGKEDKGGTKIIE
jgi:hypothetical protein